ncbi:DUF4129 domain-containing protein [Micromonospora sp. DR5-3]|uniref:DUF4129 domain-containing protein n=1 Tax=unclassified Micromonospora TaxID=2617518 RepID=UPI0011DC012D|nr:MULTISPECIES: DUF4129 domain-containing protein [unclassified Micromonospora]MCW3814704.1 DUF4129 domain-containing protein [Micromonospora sp. DR5-3]TYC23493.1 DUF4129 domain-containing protein [Micromonospora sp. MP36]
MSRWWTEAVAALGDVVPLPLAALLLLLAALLAALAWYFFPAWVPRRLPRPRLRLPRPRRPRLRLRLPRLRLPRLRLPRRRRAARLGEPAVPVPAPRTPEPAAPGHASLADRLAAEGRYAEAVRERLRDMVRALVDRQVVEPRPGMTVTELTTVAARVRPEVRPTLHAAGTIFSDLWYAQRPATPEHDRRMRDLATDLHRELAEDGERR